MSSTHLKVTRRETTGKEAAKKLRANGEVPAVVYGHKEEPLKLTVNARALRDVLAHGGARSLIVLEDGRDNETAIVKSVQRHPYKPTVVSIDFQRVSRNEEIHMTVPILLEGEAKGVKLDGGVLVQALHEIEVIARPVDIPEHITVDISDLEFNGAPIHISEIKVPFGVKFVTAGETPIAVVNPPEAEETLETPTAEEIVSAEDVPFEHGSGLTGGSDKHATGNRSDTGEKPAGDSNQGVTSRQADNSKDD